MKILHVSDTHGRPFEIPPEADLVLHTGDLFPNRTRGIVAAEERFQEEWLDFYAPAMRADLGSRPFVYVPGNHDYLATAKVEALLGATALGDGKDLRSDADSLFAEVGGIRFAGFPFVAYFHGEWNREMSETTLARILSLRSYREMDVDVFASHCPPRGVLDRCRDERIGSTALRAFLLDPAVQPPKFLCFGHAHEAAGIVGWSRGIVASNAACTSRLLEIEPRSAASSGA